MDRTLSRLRAAVLVVGAAIWAPTLGAGFTFDDQVTILDQPAVTGPLSLRALLLRDYWGAPFGHGPGTYRPVVTASFWLDWHLGGGKPWVFHLVNILLFVGLLAVAEWSLRRLAPTMGGVARWLTIGAFATLAIHVDAVPSATGRSEILSALFAIAACGFALAEDPKPRDVALSLSMFALALLSKESTLPFAVLLAWLAYRRRGRFAIGAGAVALAAAFVAFRRVSGLPLKLVGEQNHFANPLHLASPGTRLHAALQALGHYFGHLLAPIDLCPDYGYAALMPTAAPRWPTFAGVAIVLLLLLAVLRLRRPAATDAAAGFVAAYIVSANVFTPASVFVADRIFFLPSFFVVVLLGVAADASERRRPIALVAVAAMVLQGALATLGGTMWRDDERLFAYAVRACPKGFVTRLNRAQSTRNRDEAAWALVVAVDIFRRFPAPIPDEVIPASWEDEPVERRFLLYRRARGDAHFFAACSGAKRLAATRAMDVTVLAPFCH